MKIMITGGAGYIGSVLTERCLAAGHQVTVFDNLSTGHREAVHPDARFITGDVGDRTGVAATLNESGAEAVIHMAGFIEAGESMSDPGKYFRNNACRPLELLEAMRETGTGRILFSSTAAIFGDPETEIIGEDHPTHPANAYGQSKLFFEQMLDWYDSIHGIKHAALRYFNAAGASPERGEDHHPETHLIPLVLKTALGQLAGVEIYGADYPTRDGTCIRDYIHVEDLADAHLLALEGLNHSSLHFNLGNGRGYSVLEVIDAARRISGREIATRNAARRPGDPAVLVAGSEKIVGELGWRRRHPDITDIIASAWEWHRHHPQGYR